MPRWNHKSDSSTMETREIMRKEEKTENDYWESKSESRRNLSRNKYEYSTKLPGLFALGLLNQRAVPSL